MKKEQVRFIILRTIGNFFILISLFGMATTFGPALYYEVAYRVQMGRNVKYIVADKDPIPPYGPTPTFIPQAIEPSGNTLFGNLTGGNKVEYLSPVSSQFGIIIPKIGANVPIFPNVDPANADIYIPVLKKGVAHSLGSVFPGVKGNIYLFAHSTDSFWNVGRYNAVFYLLKELEKNDEIDIFFNGIRHVYKVSDKKVVGATEVNYLKDPVPFEQVTLQTCWPPGTTWKRLLVFARPEKDIK